MKRQIMTLICFYFSLSHKMNHSYQYLETNKMNNNKKGINDDDDNIKVDDDNGRR